MKKLGNVLYILTPNSYLHCQNETVAVKIGGEEKVRIPAHTIESIICLGNTTVSTPFIAFCGERGIGLSFHSENGRFYGRIHGSVSGNVLLRKKQYESVNDNAVSIGIVRNILYGKLANSRNMLMRAAREASVAENSEVLTKTAAQLSDMAFEMGSTQEIDSLRGIEGAAAARYFAAFDCMLKVEDAGLRFERRSKRPPENNVNALLSFVYMLLKNDVQSALESIGLDPAAGFLHTLRPGRPSLALDMMEEMRAPLCDRMVISLLNLKQIKAEDFEEDAAGIRISEKARRLVIDSWQKRKREEIVHPYIAEKISIGLIPYVQAQLLAKYFRGDIGEYPPIIWR